MQAMNNIILHVNVLVEYCVLLNVSLNILSGQFTLVLVW